MKKYLFLTFIFVTNILLADEHSTAHRELQFENDAVKVWKTTLMPGQALDMHRHDNSRVIVTLKEGMLKKVEEAGEISDQPFETVQAYWIDKDPEDTLHSNINDSNEPVEVMVIELKEAC